MPGNQVYMNDGSGAFVDSGQALGNSDSASLALGDIDNDGDLDFVAGHIGHWAGSPPIPVYRENKVYVNDGSGVFTDSGQSLGFSSTTSVALGDIDSDGDLDLAVGNDNYQANRVYLNDGTGIFSDSGQSLGSSMTNPVVLGDVDNDGDLDLVAGNYHPDANTVWLNDGAGIFTDSGQNFGSHSTILSLALGDVVNDGDLDLVQGSRHPSGGGYPNKVYLNDGSGMFTDSGQNLGSSMTCSIALGDLDGDGDVDIVAGNAEYGLNANKVDINQYAPAVLEASVDIHPHALNLKSEGQWITAYIELPESHNVGDVDVSTVMLNDTIPISLLDVPAPEPVPTEIGDYDEDRIPDLMVKFDRVSVDLFIYNQGITYGEASLTVTGELFDGTPFEGTDVISVNYAGDADNDGIN